MARAVTGAEGPGKVTLRLLREGEEPVGSSSVWDDWGERDAPQPAGLGRMVVELDGEPVGDVSWHSVWYGPNEGSRALNIGIALHASARGRGVGSRAQRMLAEHLFATTAVERIEASTDVANAAEQRALDKAGFTREGVLRSLLEFEGRRHDLESWSLLPGE